MARFVLSSRSMLTREMRILRTVKRQSLLATCAVYLLVVSLATGPVNAQTPVDTIPPSPVRDLASVQIGVSYPTGLFIPAYFEIDQTAAQTLNAKFDVIVVGRNANYSYMSPDKMIVLTGPAMLYSNSMANPDEWNTINGHEDWFLHSMPEMSAETRIPLPGPYPHLFYMNVGSQEWREFVVSEYAELATNNPTVRGVFVDQVPIPTEYVSQLGTAFPSYDAQTYEAAALQFMAEVKNAVDDKLVIGNTELYKSLTLAGDGGMMEGFVHFGGRGNDENISKYLWLMDIETIADVDLHGKYLLVGSGSLEPTLPAMLEYCYASFLIGYNPNAHCYFYWHSNAEGGYSAINWFPVWELSIGEPAGRYFEFEGIYRRDFSEGLVLVNPNDTGEPTTISLNGTYLNSNGNIVTSVTLPIKSGAVLKKQTWPE